MYATYRALAATCELPLGVTLMELYPEMARRELVSFDFMSAARSFSASARMSASARQPNAAIEVFIPIPRVARIVCI